MLDLTQWKRTLAVIERLLVVLAEKIGIVLKIMFPDIKLTLLDSNNKKTTFLKYVLGKLKLDATVINDRAEKYYLSDERFDVVVSRAVADILL